MVAETVYSVIVPHKNDLRGLARSLTSLSRLDSQTPAFETIVVDNDSAIGLAAVKEVAARYGSSVQVAEQLAPGAGLARNRGVSLARGSRLIFLDCDCSPKPDWLRCLSAALDQHEIVGGPVTVQLRVPRLTDATVTELFDLLFGFQSQLSFTRDSMLLSGNLGVRREVFEAVGPFRAAISEDREWSVRAAQAGYRLIVCNEASISHYALENKAIMWERWNRIVSETYAYQKEAGQPRWRWLIYCIIVAASPMIHMCRPFMDKRLRGVSFVRRLMIVRMLYGIRLKRACAGVKLTYERHP